jgi:hypothetical protein
MRMVFLGIFIFTAMFTGWPTTTTAADLLELPFWLPTQVGYEQSYDVISTSPFIDTSTGHTVRVVSIAHDSTSYEATLFLKASPTQFADLNIRYDGKTLSFYNEWLEFIIDDYPARLKKGHKSAFQGRSLEENRVVLQGEITTKLTGVQYAVGDNVIDDAAAVTIEYSETASARQMRIDAVLADSFGVLRAKGNEYNDGQPFGGTFVFDLKIPRRPF